MLVDKKANVIVCLAAESITLFFNLFPLFFEALFEPKPDILTSLGIGLKPLSRQVIQTPWGR